MLPMFRRSAVSAVAALSIALTSASPAAAWGQREQDNLKGVVGALVLKAIIDDANRNRAPVYRTQPAPQEPVYYAPQPAKTSIYRTPAARAFNSYTSGERRLIQRRLAHSGYYRGGIDGSFGPGTYSAISAYARDLGQGNALASTAGAFGVYDGLIF
jgi:hypothetical protein